MEKPTTNELLTPTLIEGELRIRTLILLSGLGSPAPPKSAN
jgi:hypothetical protein